MALVNCPECGKQVSDQATNCPHCGYPLKHVEKEKPKKKVNPDLSKMEVIMVRSSQLPFLGAAFTLILTPVCVAVAIVMPKLIGGSEIYIISIFLYILALFSFIIGLISLIKAINNTRIKTDNLYYDKEDEMFYLSTWRRSIIAIDAHDDMYVGTNKRGFGEAVVVHEGRRINLGFSKTNHEAANMKVQHIRNSLRK